MSVRTTINGVRADQYGTWCRHGHRIMVPDPTDASDYPSRIPADPWPCAEDGCTLAAYEAAVLDETERYEDERRQEYYDGILPIPRD